MMRILIHFGDFSNSFYMYDIRTHTSRLVLGGGYGILSIICHFNVNMFVFSLQLLLECQMKNEEKHERKIIYRVKHTLGIKFGVQLAP